MASVCLARGTKVGVLHRSPFPQEATAPLQERMRTNLFGRPGPRGEQFRTETCSLPAPDCLPSSFPESEGVPFNAGRMEPGGTPSPQLLTHPGGCGGLKGSASSGAGGGWVPQMMGGPSPPCPPPTPYLWPLLWEQRRPQGADRGADSQAQSTPRAGPVTQCLPQTSWERPFPLCWERLGGSASPSVVQGGARGASLRPPLPPAWEVFPASLFGF